tara:strand:+ start:227 stop:691 length:465 start_codon:yes stop_codon:yes gene_type:complete
MYLSLNFDQIDYNRFFITDITRNTVMDNSIFKRLTYSTENITFNGLCVVTDFDAYNIEKYYQKYKCVFDSTINRNIIQNINLLERNILSKNVVSGKSPKYSIGDQLQSGFIKVFLENSSMSRDNQYIILKISGIWESNLEYGVTFKFIVLSHQL